MDDREWKAALADAFADFGIPHDGGTLESFHKYMEMVLSRNETVNLTAITDRGQFLLKHFLGSVFCYGWPEVQAARCVVDVGTGAGFPGIPLAILLPGRHFLLIDSLRKRIRAVDEIVEALALKNVRTVHGRAEDLARQAELREHFDLCVSRAVANLAALAEYCLPFVQVGGWMLAYKGEAAFAEADAAGRAVSLLGGRLEGVRDFPAESYGLHHKIVVLQKTSGTPAQYPRRAGLAAKAPLG